MQISTITINNFRSVSHSKFALHDYSLLIGANNSGKSNIVDATRAFYEKLNFEEQRDFPKFHTDEEAESWIEVAFKLDDGELADFEQASVHGGQIIKVRKYLKTSAKDGTGKKKQGNHYLQTESGQEELGSLTSQAIKNGKLGNVIYVEAVGRLNEHTKLTGPSPLRELLAPLMQAASKQGDAFKQLHEAFDHFSQRVKDEKTAQGHSLSGLEDEVGQELQAWEVEFSLDIEPISENEILKNLISPNIKDKNLEAPLDPDGFGQGLQRHLIFTLIRLASKYSAFADDSSHGGLTLILFEEPEAFLHPPQQSMLSRNLQSLAKSADTQILVSTHSPNFVSHNTQYLSSIARLSKDGSCSNVGQLDEDQLNTIFSSNQDINQIQDILSDKKYKPDKDDHEQDMELIKYSLWLDPERCGMLFASHVLLVEGATERVLLNHLKDEGYINEPIGGLFILDCLGKFNMHRFMNLMESLNISHSVLFDGDNDKPPHPKVKQLIEDNQNAHTHEVKTFGKDLEGFLRIEPSGNPHRKPQHVMFKLHQGEITEDKLRELGELVDGLVK